MKKQVKVTALTGKSGREARNVYKSIHVKL